MALKTRDIRLIIKQMGLEQGTIKVLEAQNEMLVDINRNMILLAQMQDKIVDNMQIVLNIGGDMKKLGEELTKERAHEEQGVSTQSLGEGEE